ncbi:peptidase S9B dipeptidylpeptidase IV domain-containing protein [Thecamonas trahens ATCC 50062]|uniref:Peptidase S9B dipeptidylpeptidase IV domain-containing protein n=1 Tax=Thecamonas trahens ATCC 50062 TaxID=461836 RepID=A0A0L0D133_THETB|nr:peptidase S9B dipeptidylpeptidase IV domain-containing protein [Thecamonas trahens ATCC 50062]KNC45957.1 peptidase S9B dipeptidylpeptidase IV domain-containing protein [Thecamonas trahens ATCC 50062]|eukprot:XP_013762938.1 peptidase S9B dipeptidylpeptidase IV domain-containing protein [Thecamonas trahens ATCC 50062]
MATITPTDAARYPPPGTASPSSFAFLQVAETATKDVPVALCLATADGSLVQEVQQLGWNDDATPGLSPYFVAAHESGSSTAAAAMSEAELSEEEKLRRERQRVLALGVYKYEVHKKTGRVLIPAHNALRVQSSPPDSPLFTLLSLDDMRAAVPESAAADSLLDARFLPDASGVSFVFDSEVYVVDLPPADAPEKRPASKPRQVTSGARGTAAINGLADYIAQEEMGRYTGYWFSPDASRVAFTQTDSSHIPQYAIARQGDDKLSTEEHRYCFAGASNCTTRLGINTLVGEATDTLWIPLSLLSVDTPGAASPDAETYLARAHWDPADGSLVIELEDRAQTTLQLIRVDPVSGERSLLFCEVTKVWINLHDLYTPLGSDADGAFLYASEASGFLHLTYHAANGSLVRTLTSGEYMVTAIRGVALDAGVVFFESTLGGPTHTHLCAVKLDGSAPPVALTADRPGVHVTAVSPLGTHVVDAWSSAAAPTKVQVFAFDANALALVPVGSGEPVFDAAASDKAYARLGSALTIPELFSFTTADGAELHGLVFKPDAAAHGPGPYPTIVHVYGGPHVQYVLDNWSRATANMQDQMLVSAGYAVVRVDNRGSARRGLAFEGAIKHNMGEVEVADQVSGVEHLVAAGVADPSAVGIFGWSYGGYMSLSALFRASSTFHVAIAGAPVTDWSLYDTHYTERYMGTPESNPDGYHASSVLTHVDGMAPSAKLLLIHGLIDENLIAAGKHHQLLLLPSERHAPRSQATREYIANSLLAFFNDHLRPHAASS